MKKLIEKLKNVDFFEVGMIALLVFVSGFGIVYGKYLYDDMVAREQATNDWANQYVQYVNYLEEKISTQKEEIAGLMETATNRLPIFIDEFTYDQAVEIANDKYGEGNYEITVIENGKNEVKSLGLSNRSMSFVGCDGDDLIVVAATTYVDKAGKTVHVDNPVSPVYTSGIPVYQDSHGSAGTAAEN